MKGYIVGQLEEQIGKMVNDLAEGNVAQVERRFGAVEKFVLCDEKKFIDGIRDEERVREKEMGEIREKFVKAIERALENKTVDDKVIGIAQAFEALQSTEQAVMGKYVNDLVESVVSYKRNVIDKDNDGHSSSGGERVVDFVPVKDKSKSDEIDKLLDKK